MSGVRTSAEEYTRLKIDALDVLKDSGIEKCEEEVGVAQVDVDEWMKEIRDKGWTDLDWFKNVEEGRGLGSDDERENDEVEEEGELDGSVIEHASSNKRKRGLWEADGIHKNTLLTGLGTMVMVSLKVPYRFTDKVQMQDRVDYLSQSRREEYAVWKKGILARIEELNQEQATGENLQTTAIQDK